MSMCGGVNVRATKRQQDLQLIEKLAGRHLALGFCRRCQTLQDAIGHVRGPIELGAPGQPGAIRYGA